MLSPFTTRNGPSMWLSTFFTAPPVPMGSFSSTIVTFLGDGLSLKNSSIIPLLYPTGMIVSSTSSGSESITCIISGFPMTGTSGLGIL